MATADIATDAKLREALKEIPPGKAGHRQMKGSSNLAGVMAGGTVIGTMEEQDRKDQEKATRKTANGVARTREVAAKEAVGHQ